MFRKLLRKILPNPLDRILVKALRKNKKNFLFGWNRGIGDIPLGLFALVSRVKWFIPDAKITFMIRPGLEEGFFLFPFVKTIVAPSWQRGKPYSIKGTLKSLDISMDQYDLIIERPDPTYWVNYQIGRIMPTLKWNTEYDGNVEKFNLSSSYKYIAVQTDSDTDHSPWRDFPNEKWREIFKLIDGKKDYRIILFGIKKKQDFKSSSIIDLRGKTSLIDLLSILKNRCSYAILPDGGILSLIYYLNANFPLKIISLWSDVQGVLKQNVDSPNSLLVHEPIKSRLKNFSDIEAGDILKRMGI